jgi:hypothetical protein
MIKPPGLVAVQLDNVQWTCGDVMAGVLRIGWIVSHKFSLVYKHRLTCVQLQKALMHRVYPDAPV